MEKFKNDFIDNLNLVGEEYKLLKTKISNLSEQNTNLEQENTKLKNTIDELNREKKLKSSSTLWESLNSKVIEKDSIIEQLKKEIEFYKRAGTKNSTNITDKYQSNLSNSNSSSSLSKPNNSNTTAEPNLNNQIDLVPDEKKQEIITEDNIDINNNTIINNENIDNNDNREKLILDTSDLNLKKSKDKTKDKSKDKSEKKKKKKIVEDTDLDDLEKELAGLN